MRTSPRFFMAGSIGLAGLLLTPNLLAADIGLSAHAGTLGAGLDLGYSFNRAVTARFGFNKLTLSEDFTEDGIDYSTDLELESAHALADWHVLRGGFRISGGLIFNNNAFSGRGDVEPGDQVGGTTSPTSGSLSLDVAYDEVAPYLGIGWGNHARGWSPVAFSVDAGVMLQGEPDVDINQSGLAGVSESDLREEEREIENELDEFEVYPVLNASVIFRF